jgi:hypothetical protein
MFAFVSTKLRTAELKEALASAEAELQELHARVEALEEWITVTRKLCAKPVRVGSPEILPSRRTKTAGLAQHITEVLLALEQPMHVNDIVAALEGFGHPVQAKNPGATVAIALSRRPKEFIKTAPNTFGLVPRKAEPEEAKIVS